MLADDRQRKFDALHFWSLDRLSREGALETLDYLRQLTAYGVAWRSYQEHFLDSLGPLGDGIIALVACIAKMERQRIIERTQASIRLRRERGLPLGRPKAIFDREKVRQARVDGMSVRQLAKKFGVGAGTIHRALSATA
jgi:DNA invertase Pin-like site-specific DNA recombinase